MTIEQDNGASFEPPIDWRVMRDVWGRDDLMALAAVRYCLGRSSYIVGDCVEWLHKQWPHLSTGIRKTIARDIEEEIARDDEARAEGREHKPLGWDCDRARWLTTRELWAAHNLNSTT